MKKLFLACFFMAFTSCLFAQKEQYPHERDAFRVMSYNVRNARGMDNITNYQRIADIIESVSPDVLAIQEIDSVTRRSNGIDVLGKLSNLTGMHAVYGAAISFQGGKYGVGILSKRSPLSSRNIPLPGKEEQRTLLIAEFEDHIIFATHLSLTKEDRKSSIEIINQQAKAYGKPVFLIGDLNAEPDSEEIKLLSAGWKILNNVEDMTFPSVNPDRVIDYIMGYTATGSIYPVYHAKVLDDSIASDHRPLFIDIAP